VSEDVASTREMLNRHDNEFIVWHDLDHVIGIVQLLRFSGNGADPRKFSHATVISIDNGATPSVESGPAGEPTTGELGRLLARADEDEDDQQHDQQNQDQEWSHLLPGASAAPLVGAS
jgi:hypothetical protein